MEKKYCLYASDDLYAKAVKVGSVWHGMFSVPWRRHQFVFESDRKTRRVFWSPDDALRSAAKVVFMFLRDPTAGFFEGKVIVTSRDADELLREAFRKIDEEEAAGVAVEE